MDANVAEELLRMYATQVADESLKSGRMIFLEAEILVRKMHESIVMDLLRAVTMLGIEVDHRDMRTYAGRGTMRDYEQQFVTASLIYAAEKIRRQRSSNEGVVLTGG